MDTHDRYPQRSTPHRQIPLPREGVKVHSVDVGGLATPESARMPQTAAMVLRWEDHPNLPLLLLRMFLPF